MCFWSELEFYNKAYLQDLPCWKWYSAVKVRSTPPTNQPSNIVQQKLGLKGEKSLPTVFKRHF